MAPLAASAAEVVDSLLCVQAENPGQTAWAVACRTSAANPADLAKLLASGQVVRTHVLRPTWHYAHVEDIGWLLDLTAERVQRVTGQQLRVGHGQDDAAIDEALSAVVEILSARSDLTRAELAAELGARGVGDARTGSSGMYWMILLAHAELAQLVVSGRPRDGEHTYALFAGRVPHARRFEREEALGMLAVRYLRGHGPATERDLAYWATLTLGEVRRGLRAADDRLSRFDHDGRTYWHLTDDAPPRTAGRPGGHLLQILDEYYRGYQDSRWLADVAGVVPRGRETATGIALVGGQLVARVRRTVRASCLRFDAEPYRPLATAERDLIETAAQRYGAFLGLDTDLAFTDG